MTAKSPNRLWHLDLTLVPIVGGFWVPWLPFAISQRWPFCWWVLGVVDHFSRRVVGLALFRKEPSSEETCAFLDTLVASVGRAPKYTVSDQGTQFDADEFKAEWKKKHDVIPRFGALGQYGSIAVIERFFRSLKSEYTRHILVPLDAAEMRAALGLYATWFNAHRAHSGLAGRTPDELYHGKRPANKKPRWEPRPLWPRKSPCAAPQAPVRGPCGARLQLVVDFVDRRRRALPIVTLRRTA